MLKADFGGIVPSLRLCTSAKSPSDGKKGGIHGGVQSRLFYPFLSPSRPLLN